MKKQGNLKVRLLFKATLVLLLVMAPVQDILAQVNFTTKRAKLETVIKDLKVKSKYNFFYNDALGNVMVNSVNAKNESMKSVLDKLFAGTGISYKISENVVYLTKDGEAAPKSAATQQQTKGPHKVSGNVKDANGEPLIGVSIMIKGTSQGAVTDIDGNYSFTTDVANPILVYSYVGYGTQEIPLQSRARIDLIMKEETHSLSTVVVTAMGIQRKEESLTYATQRLKAEDLMRVEDPNLANSLEGKVAGLSLPAQVVPAVHQRLCFAVQSQCSATVRHSSLSTECLCQTAHVDRLTGAVRTLLITECQRVATRCHLSTPTILSLSTCLRAPTLLHSMVQRLPMVW